MVREILAERVQQELQGILQCDAEVTTAHSEYFRTINTAVSHVANSLTPEEEALVEAAMAQRERVGNDPQKQRK